MLGGGSGRLGPLRSSGLPPPPAGVLPASTPTRTVESAAPTAMDAVLRLRNAADFSAWSTALTLAASQLTPSLRDFEVGPPIGVGGGGRVFAVRHAASGAVLAMKVINKQGVLFTPSTLRNAVNERLALEQTAAGHPFLLPLRYAFQTPDHLFLLTELCEAGDLATHLRRQPQRRCGQDDLRFLAAELVLALEHIHGQDVVFRDMKPENVLLDRGGHVRVADFGLARFLPSADGCANSLCGTPSFLPPEMLNGKPYGIPADMWSLGVCLFRAVTGRLPWGRVGRASATFRSIKSDTVQFPTYLSPVTVAFLRGLLEREVARRLTIAAAKAHPFFAGLDWVDVLARDGPGLDVGIVPDAASQFRLFESTRDGELPDFLGGTDGPEAFHGPPRPPANDDPLLFDEDVEVEAGAEHAAIAAVATAAVQTGAAASNDGLEAAAMAAATGQHHTAQPLVPCIPVRTDWVGPRLSAVPTETGLATTIVGYEYSADRPLSSTAGLAVALVHRKSSADVLLSKLASIRSSN